VGKTTWEFGQGGTGKGAQRIARGGRGEKGKAKGQTEKHPGVLFTMYFEKKPPCRGGLTRKGVFPKRQKGEGGPIY